MLIYTGDENLMQ